MLNRYPEVRVQQKLDSFVDAVQVHAGNRKIAAAMRPNREHDGIEALLLAQQLGDREIASGGLNSDVERDIAGFQNFANLRFDHARAAGDIPGCPGCSIPPAT
jgi:hypothetical protein